MIRYLAAILTFLTGAAAAQEEIVLGLSHDTVSISTDFDGSDILVYGAVKRENPIPEGPPLGVIVAVSGPTERLTVYKQDRKLGIWVNAESVEVDEAPSFYAVATSAPWTSVISAVEDLRHRISIPKAIRSVGAPDDVTDAQAFTQALIRIREKEGRYRLDENTVDMREETLFSTSFSLPANLTEGEYTLRIFLTREGAVVGDIDTSIIVEKVGIERWLYNLSRLNPLAYGLLAVAIALIAGWLASAAVRLVRNG